MSIWHLPPPEQRERACYLCCFVGSAGLLLLLAKARFDYLALAAPRAKGAGLLLMLRRARFDYRAG